MEKITVARAQGSGRGDLIMLAIIIQDHMKLDSSVKGVTMMATIGNSSFIGIC